MKVAYVCADPGVPVFGRKGASVHVREVIGAMLARGAHVTLLARRLGGDVPAALRAVRLIELPPAESPEAAERELRLLDADAATARALDGCCGLDLIYERHALWSRSAMDFAAHRGIPGVLEINAPLIEEQAAYRGLAHPELAREVARGAITRASAIAAVSDMVARYARALAPDQARVHIIPNGVNIRRIHPGVPAAHASSPAAVTVGFVGTLKPWHGIETLVEAVALASRRAPVRLLIVGDGPQRATIQAMAADHGVADHVVMTGAVDPDEVPGWLASMDIAVAPYPAIDGFYFSPLKLYEYMAAGRAIVASRIGQIESVVEHGRTGVLVPPGDPAALAEAVVALAHDPGRRAQLGAAARERACAQHTWEGVVEEIVRIARPEPAGAAP